MKIISSKYKQHIIKPTKETHKHTQGNQSEWKERKTTFKIIS